MALAGQPGQHCPSAAFSWAGAEFAAAGGYSHGDRGHYGVRPPVDHRHRIRG